jgi:hypothetical protein
MVTIDSMVGMALTCYNDSGGKFRTIVDSLRYRYSPALSPENFLRQTVGGRSVAEILLERHHSEVDPED